MFEKIKKWYAAGLWSEAMVKAALDKNYITKEQYTQIVGK